MPINVFNLMLLISFKNKLKWALCLLEIKFNIKDVK